MDRQQFLSIGLLGGFISSLFTRKSRAEKKPEQKLHPGYMFQPSFVTRDGETHIVGGTVVIRRDIWDSLDGARLSGNTKATVSHEYIFIRNGHIIMSESDWLKLQETI